MVPQCSPTTTCWIGSSECFRPTTPWPRWCWTELTGPSPSRFDCRRSGGSVTVEVRPPTRATWGWTSRRVAGDACNVCNAFQWYRELSVKETMIAKFVTCYIIISYVLKRFSDFLANNFSARIFRPGFFGQFVLSFGKCFFYRMIGLGSPISGTWTYFVRLG